MCEMHPFMVFCVVMGAVLSALNCYLIFTLTLWLWRVMPQKPKPDETEGEQR